MKYFRVLLFLFSVLLFVAACKKKVEVKPPEIEVLAPGENELFVLPAIIPVKLHIVSDHQLSLLKISIDNQDQIPISVPVFLYPEVDQFDFEVDISIDNLPEGTSGNIYLHIRAEIDGAVNHEFLQLQFVGPELISKGFYLITDSGLNETKVLFFDTAFQSSDFVVLANEFSDAAISTFDDMLYLTTKSPDKLKAYHHTNSDFAWEKDAQMPFPDFYNLNLTDRLIYVGTGNGQILGFRTDSGNEQFISPLVFDSVPAEIGIYENYVVADYVSLTGPERGWLVFYKTTGALVRKHTSLLDVKAFYPALSKNQALVFGNIGSLGVIQFYDIENDKPLLSLNFTTGIITASCPMEQGFYLIAVGKDIWHFNEQLQNVQLLHQAVEDIVDLQYDVASQNVYLATSTHLSVYNATVDTLIIEIESAVPIKAVRLRLGYPDK